MRSSPPHRRPRGAGPLPSGGRPGRPRSADVDARLKEAVLQLLGAAGPTAVTVDAVAERSGIAKTTIYRRHANRLDLLRAVLTSAIGAPQPLPEGNVRAKIRFALEQTWGQMEAVLGRGGLAAILVDSDPEFSALLRATLRPFDDQLVARIREDSGAGLLRPDVDAEGAVTMMVGAYLGELLRRGVVEDAWLDRCLELTWATLAPR